MDEVVDRALVFVGDQRRVNRVVAANRSHICICRDRRPYNLASDFHGMQSLEYYRHHGPGRQEINIPFVDYLPYIHGMGAAHRMHGIDTVLFEIFERLVAHAFELFFRRQIMFADVAFGGLEHFQCHEAIPFYLETAYDRTDKTALESIGFGKDECLFFDGISHGLHCFSGLYRTTSREIFQETAGAPPILRTTRSPNTKKYPWKLQTKKYAKWPG